MKLCEVANANGKYKNVYAETTFVCPSYWLADAFANSTISHSAYKYQYSVPPAQHAYDVGVYFGPQRPKYASPDFAAAFMRMSSVFLHRCRMRRPWSEAGVPFGKIDGDLYGMY